MSHFKLQFILDEIIHYIYDPSVEQLFRTTEKLIKDQTEIARLSTIDWKQPVWRTLLTDRAVQIATAKTFVFSERSTLSVKSQW